jgi:hypothetical protein
VFDAIGRPKGYRQLGVPATTNGSAGSRDKAGSVSNKLGLSDGDGDGMMRSTNEGLHFCGDHKRGRGQMKKE